jgi:hypothetical protein
MSNFARIHHSIFINSDTSLTLVKYEKVINKYFVFILYINFELFIINTGKKFNPCDQSQNIQKGRKKHLRFVSYEHSLKNFAAVPKK